MGQMIRLRNFLRRLHLHPLEPEDYAGGGRRPVDSVDALAAASSRGEKADGEGGEFPGSVPPNYIKTYDEGRPRH
jgi:hypothetical protein